MYDIRQFKPALYALVLLGITGFALAAQWPGLWVIAVALVLLNGWLVKTGRFVPMPRILASVVTIGAFIYIIDQLIRSPTTQILIIGLFLVLLQIIKLFEQRANRDYAQLVILSLLLMVAAAINTASLLFGLLFIAYLFLSLFVCLLFHLKVESEEARKAIALPDIEPNPATLRQDQRYLSSSMRRLTALISIISVAMAVMVFLFFPRGTGANLLGPLQFKPPRALTGFSEQVGFQQVARITQNTAKVADVRLYRNDKLVEGTQPLYLRGLTLDHYTGVGADNRWSRQPYQWVRLLRRGDEVPLDREDSQVQLIGAAPSDGDVWRQEVTLQPTGSSVLFARAGVVSIGMGRRSSVVFSPYDRTLQLGESVMQPIEYTVVSNDRLPYLVYVDSEVPRRRYWSGGGGMGPGGFGGSFERPPRPRSIIDPRIPEYARRPEVSGVGPNNVPLVQLRDQAIERMKADGTYAADGLFEPPTQYDTAIAAAMVRHLQNTFTYTLDLTDAARIEGDPMVAFLYDLKRGHCEYFAGAMTLMCQSLGIPARMVIGFRCDEYNAIGHYYGVQQNHAHAWVEVRLGEAVENAEWITFDPTTGRLDNTQRQLSFMTRIQHFFDYLEHTWANNVIAYDRGARDNLVQNLETSMTRTVVAGSQNFDRFPQWLQTENWRISSTLLTGLVVLAVSALIGAIGWFVWERWRLRRRAERIGLDVLPADERLRLVRQLGFYDNLVRLLERRGMTRPRHLTPMEFSDSLAFLPADAYHTIRRLTEVFYRIRYGRHELTPAQREKLDHSIAHLETILGAAKTA